MPLDDNPPQNLTIEQGCYGSGSCSGSVSYYYTCTLGELFAGAPRATPPNAVERPPPPPPVDNALTSGFDTPTSAGASYFFAYQTCDSYNAADTYSATQGAVPCIIPQLSPGPSLPSCTLWISGCGCSGDTLVSVARRNGTVISNIDDDSLDYCSANNYRCSSGSIELSTATTPLERAYTLNQGCFSSGSCGGAITWCVARLRQFAGAC